jgi:hypothetical protein
MSHWGITAIFTFVDILSPLSFRCSEGTGFLA